MNPFNEKSCNLSGLIKDWNALKAKPYDKNQTDAFTKTRIILMNGTEFEQNWYLHSFLRHCQNNDLRRDLALLLKLEQQQQKLLSSLKPCDESILETTIGFEQLAVDLTAALAKKEPNEYVKSALNFALLEDFDHLYRYANLLEMDMGIEAKHLVGGYTEIMPARPTISEHRHPYDDVRRYINSNTADLLTKLHVGIITAAEQQTMNYYMNVGQFYTNDIGRALYTEIAMIEVQHVTEYGSLIDTECSWLEGLVMRQYTECYLYFSCYEDESDKRIKEIWRQLYEEELAHLKFVCTLIEKYENKTFEDVVGEGTFPTLLKFESNIEYVRAVIESTVNLTGNLEDYTKIGNVELSHRFYKYQDIVNPSNSEVASHNVIKTRICRCGEDYRFMTQPHPLGELRDRTTDNTDVGRYLK